MLHANRFLFQEVYSFFILLNPNFRGLCDNYSVLTIFGTLRNSNVDQ